MTLALHGKSRKRQGWLIAIAVAMVTLATVAGTTLRPSESARALPPPSTTTNLVARPAAEGGALNNLLGVAADAAPGFSSGSFAANATGAGTKSEIYFTPESLFGGREVALGDVASMSYWTKTGALHTVDPRDWFLAMYTKPYGGDVSTPSWYGDRIGAEPYFSASLTDPAGTWNQWSTDGASNKLRFFESTEGAPGANFGTYTDPDWATLVAGNALSGLPYASHKILYVSIQTGSAWANGFTGQLDGLRIVLTDGSVATVNFEPDVAPCTATCYADAVSGNDANSGLAPSEAKKTIQAAIDQVSPGGQVRVLPGNYSEKATNRFIGLNGLHQFGLFFPASKPGITLMGVDGSDAPVVSAAATLATVNTNATNNFGYSGIFVEAANTTIQGLKIGPNAAGDNKTIEVIGDNFTLRHSTTSIPGGGGSVYINDWSAAGDVVKSYHILDNIFPDGTSIDIASGAGASTALGANNREILGNAFNLQGGDWNAISFSGSGTGVPWFVNTVGGAVIKGNSFSGGGLQYIRARGTYVEAEFDWQSFWDDNAYDKATVALVTESPFVLRSFSYLSAPYTFANVRRIGTTAQGEINNSVAGDTVLVKAGTYPESPNIDRSLTLKSESGRNVTTIALQPGPTYLGGLTVTGSGNNTTIDGFTIEGRDAVDPGLASSNIVLTNNLGSVKVVNNRLRVGKVGSGANGDDGIGLINYYDTSTDTASLSVENNIFEPLSSDGFRAFYINPGVAVFSFKNNVIQGTFTGSAITQAKTGLVENNTVTGTGAAGSRSAGLGVWGYPDPGIWGHTTFRRNTITGTRRAIGLYSGGNVLAEKNILTNNGEGIWVGDSISASLIATLAAHRNSITNSDTVGINNTLAGAFNATCNWYGAANGPGVVGPGTGDKVTANVTFSPWLVTSDLTGACPVAAPAVTTAAPDAFGNEGDTLSTAGAFSGTGLTLTANNTAGTFTPNNAAGTWTWSLATTDDVAQAIITVTATDLFGTVASDAFDYRALNVAPTLAITAPLGGALYAVNTPVSVASGFTDPGSGDTHTCTFAWDDTAVTGPVASVAGACNASHTFTAPGVYTIVVTVTD
ncbi:MAG: hypothetical protein C0506_13110, partial [Anaerolinea sp.]|nr:hypothetical protein [Anaerolinea sp.]